MSQGSSNPTTDLKKIGGVPVDVNSGNSSTGTQRVVIASDQVALPITDNGGSLTVDGTVAATQSGSWDITNITNTVTVDGTVELGATTLSALETINAVQSGAWTVSATQSGTWNIGTVTTVTSVTNDVNIADGGNSITVDAPVTTPAFVRLSNGSSAVDTLPVSQSGTWNIGTLTSITNDVNIADGGNSITVDDGNGSLTVDGTVSLSSSTLTALETINAVQSGTWDIGTVSTVTSITNVVSVDDNGSTLSIDDGGGSITVDGTVVVSGTTTVSGTVTLNNQDIHDGAAGTALSMVGGYASLSAPTAVVDGDAARIWVTRNGAVNIADGGGSITVDDGGNTLSVDGTVSLSTATLTALETINAVQSGSWTVAATQSGTWNIGTLTSITNDVNIADGGNSITVDDGGSSLTVDGTVAATQSGGWTVSLSADDVHNGVAGTTGVMNVGYASASAPTAVANGDAARFWLTTAGALNIADGGGSISIDDGGNTITVDGTVAATQSGTWNVGTVSTVTSITNVVSVDDNGSTLSIDDGNGSITVDDGGGALTVDGTVTANQGGSWTVTVQDGGNSISIDDGGNTITVDGTITANLNGVGSITDNATFTQGTDRIIVSGYIYDETAGTAVSENDAAAARINVNRAVVNAIEDGTTRGRYATVTAANALKVDNSGVTQPVSGTVSVNSLPAGNNNIGNVDIASALPAGNNNIGNVDVVSLPALPAGTNSIGDIANITNVVSVDDNGGSLTVDGTVAATQSGTWNIGTVTTVSAVTRVNQWNGNTIATGSGSVSTGTLRTVEAGASTGSQTNPSLSTSSATVLAASTSRRGATIYNGSTSTLYLRLSATAASTSTYTVRLYPDDYYEVPSYYNGVITGVLDTGSTTAVQVTQIT